MKQDKISKSPFFPQVRTKLMKDLLKAIDGNWDKLLIGHRGKKKEGVCMTLHRLKESLVKLDYRYFDLGEIVRLLDQLQSDEMGEPLHYWQIAFVDVVEAFHQQIYSTLSTLILVLNHLGLNGKKHPINSVKKFLEFVKEKQLQYRSALADQIDILQKSRDFRSKFIDHPQQHQLHDWMTHRTEEGEMYIIFFKRKGKEVYAPTPKHPSDPEFKPPVNCGKDFYISPDERKTLKAIEVLIKHMLNL